MNSYNFVHAIIQGEYTDLINKVNNQLKIAAKIITYNSNGRTIEIRIDKYCSPVRYYDPFWLRHFRLVSILVTKGKIHIKFEFNVRKPLKKLSTLALIDRITVLNIIENHLKMMESNCPIKKVN